MGVAGWLYRKGVQWETWKGVLGGAKSEEDLVGLAAKGTGLADMGSDEDAVAAKSGSWLVCSARWMGHHGEQLSQVRQARKIHRKIGASRSEGTAWRLVAGRAGNWQATRPLQLMATGGTRMR